MDAWSPRTNEKYREAGVYLHVVLSVYTFRDLLNDRSPQVYSWPRPGAYLNWIVKRLAWWSILHYWRFLFAVEDILNCLVCAWFSHMHLYTLRWPMNEISCTVILWVFITENLPPSHREKVLGDTPPRVSCWDSYMCYWVCQACKALTTLCLGYFSGLCIHQATLG